MIYSGTAAMAERRPTVRRAFAVLASLPRNGTAQVGDFVFKRQNALGGRDVVGLCN